MAGQLGLGTPHQYHDNSHMEEHLSSGGVGGGQQHLIGEYIVTQQIGAGSFAVVWKAHHWQHPGFQVAIKEIATERLNKNLQESLRSEIAILQRTDHPNIIRLHDIIEGQNRIYLVLEYCAGGDLAAYIQRYGKVTEVVARHFMRQLGDGLQVLRNNNLIHCDLKPQNLLLSTNDDHAVLKIADLGFARSLMPQGMAETLCDSPLYMAPEILQSKRYDAKADLWSVGAILYQLVSGRPPFSGNSHDQLLQNIIESTEIRFPDEVSAQLHSDCLDMCRKLLRRDPVERLAFEDFFAHPFMEAMRPKAEDIQAGGNTSGGTGEASENSQENCFQFPLDDDQQGSVDRKSPFSRRPMFTTSPTSSPFLPPTERKIDAGHSTRMGFPATDHIDDRSRILYHGAEESAALEADHHSGSSTEAQVTIARPAEEQTSNNVFDANAEPWSPSQLNRALLSQAWRLKAPLPKKLLILDVNGLLVARYSKIDRSVIPMDAPYVVVSKSYMFKRPFCDSFLAFCFENFNVGLWSSMMQANVFRALDHICQGWQDKCRFVMHQGDCTNTGLKNPEKKKQPLFLKELMNVWSKFPQFNETNTLLIDDTPYKALRNPPYTAIFPEAYWYNEADIFLEGPLVDYLTQLRDAADVREFVREHPIGLPALAPGSLHWDFFQQVLKPKTENVSPLRNAHPHVPVVKQAAPTRWGSPLRNTPPRVSEVPQAAPTGWDSPPQNAYPVVPGLPQASPTGWDSPPQNTHPVVPVVPQASPTGWDSPPRNTHPVVPVVPQAARTGWDSLLHNTHSLVPVAPQAARTWWDLPRHNTPPLVPVAPQAARTWWDLPRHNTPSLVPVVPQAARTWWDFAERENEIGEPLPPGTY